MFAMNEMLTLLAVLKALHKLTGADFIAQAIADIQLDLRLKQLPVNNYFHICEHCFRELDERDPNSFKMTTRSISGEENVKWVHYKCPELKPDSTRER